MAGNVKVGGNVIATHTGVEGAGTVTLSNVTASALKMSSSGNTITDSAGNAVLSESGGNVTLGSVRLPASGGIKNSSGSNVLSESGGVVTLGESVNPNNSYAYYTMANTGGAGTGVGVITGYTSVLEDTNFYTSSFASLALTVNIAKAGYYKISNTFYIYGNANVPLYQYTGEITGTSTKYGLPADNILRMNSGLNQYVSAGISGLELTFLIQATASQTIIIKPLFSYTLNCGTLYFGSNLEIIKVK